MKFERMVFWITILLIYAMATRISIDSDTWWHLRAGQWMIENHQLLTKDFFSLTRYGAEWRYPGWMVEIPMASIVWFFGLGGLNILTGVMIATAFGFIYRITVGPPLARAFLLILAATVNGVYWSARPHLVTILLAAVFLYTLEKAAQKGFANFRIALWTILPILMFCWVNSHGGFIVGFVLYGIYFVELILEKLIQTYRERQPQYKAFRNKDFYTMAISGLGMILVAMINPLGYQIFLYPFRTVSIRILGQYIEEWQSPNFHNLSVQPFIWLLILLLWVLAFSHKKWLLRDALLISFFLYLALMAGRNIALFALVAPLSISRLFSGTEMVDLSTLLRKNKSILQQGQEVKERPKLNLLIIGFVLIACIYRSYAVYPNFVLQEEFDKLYPVNAVEFIKSNSLEGNLFNSYNWGGYLLWYLPEYPVFVDGRTDLYDDEILEQWFQVAQLKDDWQTVINQWQIRIILMEKDWLMAKHLQQNGWCLRYHDEVALVFVSCP